jgi:hypothetical protein
LRAFGDPGGGLMRIQGASFAITGPVTNGIVSTRPDGPPPVLRLRQGGPFLMTVENALDD